jgi:hypothetical protein
MEITSTTPGTRPACGLSMRVLLAVVLFSGCFGGSVGGGSASPSRPAVMPMLSELPGDATKRDAVLDQSNAVAGPEQRKGMTRKERKVETAAATAAALIGGMFSSTQSATLGSATVFDEDLLIAPTAAKPAAAPGETRAAPNDDAGPSNADLVPWIKLK